jgi:hypothetical protein
VCAAAQPLVKVGCHELSPKLGLNHDLPNLQLPSSQDYRLELTHPSPGIIFLMVKQCLWGNRAKLQNVETKEISLPEPDFVFYSHGVLA